MASVNGNEFLTDPTGSRRFLPFEVLRIDKPTAESIHMDNVYGILTFDTHFNYATTLVST